MREIAEEGHRQAEDLPAFTDKSDLFVAIGERLRDMLWAAIFPSVNLATDSAREVIQRSVEEYVNLVDSIPTCCGSLFRRAQRSTSEARFGPSTRAVRSP